MPTATPFTALGKGNGFTVCLTNVDISEVDHYEPLSLREAMSMYWNLSGASASFTALISENTNPEFGTPINYSFNKSLNSSYEVTPEPIERICSGFTISPTGVSNQMTAQELIETGGAGCGGTASFSQSGVVRMYDGDIQNPFNFVGYGISQIYISETFSSHLEGILDTSSSIVIGSYMNGQTESGSNDNSGSGEIFVFKRKASTVSINGITFRSYTKASASGPTASLSRTLSVSSSSAFASGTVSGERFSVSSSCSVQGPTMQFYNY
tara:strand:- start:215 stop:1018 length:804 start_codon:yes stop_codon:yes gene_type:complete